MAGPPGGSRSGLSAAPCGGPRDSVLQTKPLRPRWQLPADSNTSATQSRGFSFIPHPPPHTAPGTSASWCLPSSSTRPLFCGAHETKCTRLSPSVTFTKHRSPSAPPAVQAPAHRHAHASVLARHTPVLFTRTPGLRERRLPHDALHRRPVSSTWPGGQGGPLGHAPRPGRRVPRFRD